MCRGLLKHGPAQSSWRRFCRQIRCFALRGCLTAGLATLCGCYGGTALLTLTFLELSEETKTRVPPPSPFGPARAEVLDVARASSDTVRVRFQLAADPQKRLGVQVGYAEVFEGPDGEETESRPRAATPREDSSLFDHVPPGLPLTFTWDAKQDLQNRVVPVRFVLTPLEDGVPMEPARSQLVWGGNTTPALQSVLVTGQENVLVVSFHVVDGESDPVELVGVETRIEPAGFAPLPENVFSRLRQSFPSSPSGILASFVLRLSDLSNSQELGGPESFGESGFVGEVEVKVSVRDFPGVEPAVGTASLDLDNNEPPTIEVLPIFAADLASGIIPIRFRLFDLDLNRAAVAIRVRFGDSGGFQRANEFPSSMSSGTEELATLPFSAVGDTEQPAHSFLWDALSQIQGDEEVTLVVSAEDREPGSSIVQSMSGFSLSSLRMVGELEAGQTPVATYNGDFNGDAINDVVVAGFGSDTITYFLGEEGLLRRVGEFSVPFGARHVSSGDYDGDGSSEVAVGTAHAPRIVLVDGVPEEIVITLPQIITVNDFPLALETSDFNGDGFADLAVVSETSGDVTYLEGSETGLAIVRQLPVGESPACVESRDLDRDGYPDLLVSNEASGTVSCLRGGAAGLFLERHIEVGADPRAITSGDYDGDGHVDVAVASAVRGIVTVLNGKDQLSVGQVVPVGDRPIALTSGDFDADGLSDIVVANLDSRTVSQINGHKDKLAVTREHVVGEEPIALTGGHFDSDGFLDLAVVNRGSASVTLFRGTEEGLTRVGEIGVGDAPIGLVSGDYNADGFIDLGVANRDSGTLTYVQGGAGAFGVEKRTRVGTEPTAAITIDLNGDGFEDLVLLDNDPDGLIYIQGSPTGPRETRELEVGQIPIGIAAGDFDRDGFVDLAVANRGSDDLTLLSGTNEGPVFDGSVAVGTSPVAATTGDYDGDEFADVVTVNRGTDDVSYLRGSPDGLVHLRDIKVGSDPLVAISEDFDRDGFLDVVVANFSSDTVTYLRGTSAGLVAAGDIETGDGPRTLTSGDFDGDGHPDVVVANFGSGGPELDDVTYIRGTKQGLLRSAKVLVGDAPRAVTRGDYNGDGFLDVVVANSASQDVTYLRGSVVGLVRMRDIAVGLGPAALASGNFDGDEFLDIAVANSADNRVTVLRGSSQGPRRVAEIVVGSGPRLLSAGDHNRDGLVDLVATHRGSNELTYLRQRYLTPHCNAYLEPDTLRGHGRSLVDPRSPPRYCLHLPAEALDSPRQVCVVPSPTLELPQGEAFKEGKYLVAVTGGVTLLRPGTRLNRPALLTLRLRESVEFSSEMDSILGCKVFYWEPGSQTAIRLEVRPSVVGTRDICAGRFERRMTELAHSGAGLHTEEFRLNTEKPAETGWLSPRMSGRAVPLHDDKWVQFPIDRFGTYVVASERAREGRGQRP